MAFAFSESPHGIDNGYQVVKLFTGSPAHQAGLLPFFDYLVAADNVTLGANLAEFADLLTAKKGEGIVVDVYNARQRATRQVSPPAMATGRIPAMDLLEWVYTTDTINGQSLFTKH